MSKQVRCSGGEEKEEEGRRGEGRTPLPLKALSEPGTVLDSTDVTLLSQDQAASASTHYSQDSTESTLEKYSGEMNETHPHTTAKRVLCLKYHNSCKPRERGTETQRR